MADTLSARFRGTALISWGSIFGRRPAPLLGLDLGTSSIKLVELGRDPTGNLVLERCAAEPLDRGWVADGNIEKFDDVADALRRLVTKSGSGTRRVAMALPPSAVISKKITLPGGMGEDEFGQQVETEAGQYIPFALDDVYLDFCIIGASPALAGHVDVLIAAARRERVQDMQGLAEAAGLTAVVVDIASHAAHLATRRIVACQPTQGKGGVVALFEVGTFATRMQVLRDGDVVFDRDQAMGGDPLTQQIARHYGLPVEAAETRKRHGELPDDYGPTVLAPFMQALVQELGRALQIFFANTPHSRVDSILLAGGGVMLPRLAAAVTAHTAFPCSLLNPFDGMAMDEGVRSLASGRDAPAYLTACGLALRRFDR
jgi:type IV pilus assembly protein PilM